MKLDFINELNIDYEANPYSISGVKYNPNTRNLTIKIKFNNVLSLNDYLMFKDAFYNHFKGDNIKINIDISYHSQKSSEDTLRNYLDYIVHELCTKKARYSTFKDLKPKFSDNTFTYVVACDATGIGVLTNDIEEGFKHYGLDITVNLEFDENISIESEIEELNKRQRDALKKMEEESKELRAKVESFNAPKKYGNPYDNLSVTKIKDIPLNNNDLQIYALNQGVPNFVIEGSIFALEIKTFTNSTLCTLKITDESDSIIVKKWLRGQEIEEYSKLKNGDFIRVNGRAEFDPFAKSVVIMSSKITFLEKRKTREIVDDATTKRVELHAHSKMSALDAIVDPEDYIDIASKMGHKAIAVTDHSGVYSIASIDHVMSKYPDVKPIFGVELNYIDDSKYFITFNKTDIDLASATYVVFDLETTGLAQQRDKIIEVAATKCNSTGIIDTFNTFVNPGMSIPEKITEITSITDDMVKDAPSIDVVLRQFLEFSKDSILVAHNASFDVGIIRAQMKELGLEEIDFPVIDTLNGFRALHFNDVKKFNLKELAKFYKVNQEHHHRAIDDTRVTAECFLLMLNELYAKGINNYKEINSLIDPDIFYKALIPNHINILVKTQLGLKNTYKLLSDALTNHCYKEARLLRSVLEKHREGIIVSSGCVNGEVFQEALIGNYDDLLKLIDFYDIIEVQPPLAYAQLFDDMPNGKEVIEDTIKLIIKASKEKNKLVVATSDSHYLFKEDKSYRDILISSPQAGGMPHSLARYNVSPDMHLRTTNEMLEEFNFLNDDKLAYEIVVTNTNLVADSIDQIQAFPKDMFAPRDDEFKKTLGVDSIVETTRQIVKDNVYKYYGDNPHPIVKKRIDRELESIISNGYASVYYMSHLLVTKSLKDGYLVGSRGSVGSSLVATMMMITEINPLQPHYRCPKCKFQTFKMNEEEKQQYPLTDNELEFQSVLSSVESGYDLPDAYCPVCGEKLIKDGHDIPFETFLGFNGDKVPDIDLNFSGDYQPTAHEFIREFMGSENAFRGGTISKLQEKNGYGYVKKFCEKEHKELRGCEIDRLSTKLVGVRRSSGQHPGGIIVVPHYVEIYDVTPVQYPADNTDNPWRTTHFDYHSFENNLLKLDVLGHDDPTMIKYLMDYVHLHQEDYPFDNPQDIPIDDKNVYRLFNSTDVINVSNQDIDSPVASFAVPEFGTTFVRKLLSDTLPKTFAELVKISGLSHGTGVWAGNAQELVLGTQSFGKIPFSDVIGCRDDIMVYLLYQNLEPLKAFQIMEFVRKGKVKKDPEKWKSYKDYMIEKKVPEWYIWSCEQIEYMFPKAHATAYVLMALRIAWFKVYSPKLFYSAWFTNRAKGYNVKAMVGGKLAVNTLINELQNKPNKTAVDDDLLSSMYVVREMLTRGIKFLPVDIMKSDSKTFIIEDEGLRIPFVAVDGLGESVAIDIVEKRNEKLFTSKQDVQKRTRLNQTLFAEFENLNAFGDLPEKEKEEEFGLFGAILE